jgi:hypothetical protein
MILFLTSEVLPPLLLAPIQPANPSSPIQKISSRLSTLNLLSEHFFFRWRAFRHFPATSVKEEKYRAFLNFISVHLRAGKFWQFGHSTLKARLSIQLDFMNITSSPIGVILFLTKSSSTFLILFLSFYQPDHEMSHKLLILTEPVHFPWSILPIPASRMASTSATDSNEHQLVSTLPSIHFCIRPISSSIFCGPFLAVPRFDSTFLDLLIRTIPSSGLREAGPAGLAIIGCVKGVVGWGEGGAAVGGNYCAFITQNPSRLYQ